MPAYSALSVRRYGTVKEHPLEGKIELLFPHKGRVAHISLVFREMWDFPALSR
jgi:hypothetical protein